ncbi:MAG: hypothetical protein F6J93_00890 [Oscillatoria sp. SIO1A7]|nr:hypothetical protein [Oscillatoria sp. SIO1A7]
MAGKKTRRNFLAASAAIAGGIIGSAALKDSVTSARTPKAGTMPERILGKTGVSIPILGLGGAGYPLGSRGDNKNEAKALAIIERAVELGIRYFDTASSYGPNEVYLAVSRQRSAVSGQAQSTEHRAQSTELSWA